MKIGNTILSVAAAAAMLVPPAAASTAVENQPLERDIRRAINSLAYYGVFDDLTFSMGENGTVTLHGQVMHYNLRNSALSAVRNVPGVARVVDNIEVLPLSPYDNNIRVRAYRAIFGYPALSRYALNPLPPIRILVKNGSIKITGVVNNELDRTLIENRIRALPGAFAVSNELRLDSDRLAG